jgi:[2Fe-2S] binding domain
MANNCTNTSCKARLPRSRYHAVIRQVTWHRSGRPGVQQINQPVVRARWALHCTVCSALTRELCVPDAERLGAFHASQCGYCTPGFTVAMHGVLREAQERNAAPTADDFQAGLDGNLCRCTGYRPIIDACKVSAAVWSAQYGMQVGSLIVTSLRAGSDCTAESHAAAPANYQVQGCGPSALPSQLKFPVSRDVAHIHAWLQSLPGCANLDDLGISPFPHACSLSRDAGPWESGISPLYHACSPSPGARTWRTLASVRQAASMHPPPPHSPTSPASCSLIRCVQCWTGVRMCPRWSLQQPAACNMQKVLLRGKPCLHALLMTSS